MPKTKTFKYGDLFAQEISLEPLEWGLEEGVDAEPYAYLAHKITIDYLQLVGPRRERREQLRPIIRKRFAAFEKARGVAVNPRAAGHIIEELLSTVAQRNAMINIPRAEHWPEEIPYQLDPEFEGLF
jgi:hypothetical protein